MIFIVDYKNHIMRTLTLLLAIGAFLSLASLNKIKKLTVTSSAFANNGTIPVKYTCLGQSASPPLTITNIPPEARSLAVIICDPDAVSKIQTEVENHTTTKATRTRTTNKKVTQTKRTRTMDACTVDGFTHWVVWNIDTGSTIPENFRNDDMGMNSAKQQGYIGMCPPTGMHHYIFRVYALDTKLKIDKNTDRKALEKIMTGHIVAQGEITGTYDKSYR
jgi:Raf kinase inhibitor-like YbhB/YbcL family protein